MSHQLSSISRINYKLKIIYEDSKKRILLCLENISRIVALANLRRRNEK
jgi:hypothetical protein